MPAARAWSDRHDSSPYLPLLATAARAARGLVAGSPASAGAALPPSYAFIVREARRLARSVDLDGLGDALPGWQERIATSAAGEMMRLLLARAPDLAGGSCSGEQLLQDHPALWERFMVEWPLGSYALLAAEVMEERGLLHGRVLELGAGVGNASRLVAPAVGDGYVRTDLVAQLLDTCDLPGTTARYDFDRPGSWRGLDAVLAVNALHCARDKGRTLRHVAEMLRPGGTLVLAEGAPETRPGLPWALTYLCGLFVGWWDVGGFLPREQWLAHLAGAGLEVTEVRRLVDGDHDLGGVVLARRVPAPH